MTARCGRRLDGKAQAAGAWLSSAVLSVTRWGVYSV